VLVSLKRLSQYGYGVEVRNIAGRITAVLIPAAILVGVGIFVSPTENAYAIGILTGEDIPLVLSLLLTAAAAVVTTIPTNHLTLVLALSVVGYSLAAVYAFFGGPNVTLVAVLIGTISTLLLLAVLALFPRAVMEHEERRSARPQPRWRDPILGGVAGLLALLVTWATLSQPAAQKPVMVTHIELTPIVHARDATTAILADFRGLDTLGEVSVIAIVLLGITTWLRTNGR
jgi:multicomponent Na+:H+ antiporter subunit A